MPWTCRFLQDTEQRGLGTMYAEFTDANGVQLVALGKQMKEGDTSQHGPFLEECISSLNRAREELAAAAAVQEFAVHIAEKLNSLEK